MLVNDCEEIRKILLKDAVDKKWSLLGQSFGGFCCTTYLSFYPASLKDVLITGGLPPLVNNPDPVYEALYSKISFLLLLVLLIITLFKMQSAY